MSPFNAVRDSHTWIYLSPGKSFNYLEKKLEERWNSGTCYSWEEGKEGQHAVIKSLSPRKEPAACSVFLVNITMFIFKTAPCQHVPKLFHIHCWLGRGRMELGKAKSKRRKAGGSEKISRKRVGIETIPSPAIGDPHLEISLKKPDLGVPLSCRYWVYLVLFSSSGNLAFPDKVIEIWH